MIFVYIIVWSCHQILASTPPTNTGVEARLPVVDLSGWFGEDVTTRKDVAAEVKTALLHPGPGFMYIKNHGVDPDIGDRCYNEANAFFAMSKEEKESFELESQNGYKGVNNTMFYGEVGFSETWLGCGPFLVDLTKDSTSLPQLETCVQYSLALKELSQSLLRIFATALEIDEEFFTTKVVWNEHSTDCYRLNYYPPMPAGMDHPRLGAHSDWSLISVVQQKEPGLEIWNKELKRWELAAPKDGTFVVNTGDMMQFWTNDLFPSGFHRVRAQPSKLHEKRLSIAYFSNVNVNVKIDARDVFPNELPNQPPVHAGEYFAKRMELMYHGSFAETVAAELDVADDRVEAMVSLQSRLDDMVFRSLKEDL